MAYCFFYYKNPSLSSLRRQVESLVYPSDNILDPFLLISSIVRYKWVLGRTLEQEPLLLYYDFKPTLG